MSFMQDYVDNPTYLAPEKRNVISALREASLAEILTYCDVEYLRSSIQSVGRARRCVIASAAVLSREDWLAKRRLLGKKNLKAFSKNYQPNLTPEQRSERSRKRWAHSTLAERKAQSLKMNLARLGEKPGRPKTKRKRWLAELSPRERRWIKEAIWEGDLSIFEIANEFGIHERSVYRLCKEKKDAG